MAAPTKAKKAVKKTAKRTTAKKTAAKRGMTATHKAALAVGRNQATAVRAYLDALEANKPKRGRRVTPDVMRTRIAKLNEEIKKVPKSRQLQLVQDRMNLEDALARTDESFDIKPLQRAFAKNAKAYARRKNISYAAFREIGVSPAVLKEAGLTRSF